MGSGAEGMRYRFQWNFPVFFSPHNPEHLYTCSQFAPLHQRRRIMDIISPDLTRGEAEKLVSSGGPITKDNTGVEYYATVFAAAESPRESGLIWAGSDDGLIHVTRDAGTTWQNVTPKGMPADALVNSIEADPHRDGGLYVAATRYNR